MCAVVSAAVRIGCNRVRHESYIVFRMSYIARKETRKKEDEIRSQPERFQWKKSERGE